MKKAGGRGQEAGGRRQEAVPIKNFFHHQVMKVASSEVACCLLPTFKSGGRSIANHQL